MKYLLLFTIGIVGALAANDNKSCQIACSEKFGVETTTSNFACNRGCRFSAINQFLSLARPSDSNDECESNCKNSYADNGVMQACIFGCNSQGVLSPLGQMLESQPNFGADPLLSPSTFFDAVTTFLDDFSSAMTNKLPVSGADDVNVNKPVGFIRVIQGNFPDSPQTHLISVKLSTKNGGAPDDLDDIFNSDELFGGDIMGDITTDMDLSKPTGAIFVKSTSLSSSRCLAPLYDTLPGPKCRAYFPRWQFNRETGKCEKFIFGGCPEVDNMFSTFEECNTICSQFADSRDDQPTRSFELWLLIFCFGALGLCALLGAISSACLYCCRRRQRPAQRLVIAGHEREDEAKIFLVAPQMGGWSSDVKPPMMTALPTYADVIKATQDQSKPEAVVVSGETDENKPDAPVA